MLRSFRASTNIGGTLAGQNYPHFVRIAGNRSAWLFDSPCAMVWSMTVGTGVQAVELSPYMPCADDEGLESFVLSRLFPPCYTPPSLSGFSSPDGQG